MAERWEKIIDRTFIQSKMLNKSKGPAVHSLVHRQTKQCTAERCAGTGGSGEPGDQTGRGCELLVEDGNDYGSKTFSGAIYHCKAVIICSGTYLKARCIYGDVSLYTGPNGLQAANYLTDS